MRLVLLVLAPLVLLTANIAIADDPSLSVVATTTIVADVARAVGGAGVNVTALVPPDSDAHAFQPTPQDALVVEGANLILAVGAGYETFLNALIQNTGGVSPVEISRGVEMFSFASEDGEFTALGKLGDEGVCANEHAGDSAQANEQSACDPHVWTDPKNVMVWASNIAAAFSEADPANAEIYQTKAATYIQELKQVDEEIQQIFANLPAERRVLVTNHEFMSYFARAYCFRMAGVVVPGGSTEGEVDPQVLAALIETVKSLGVPAIFAEVTSNTRIIDALAQDAGVRVVTTLSESLTDSEGAAPTYLDYLRYNARTIDEALGQK